MIEKIIQIKTIGRFSNYKLQASEAWNGQLGKINIIYAPNGSGKTTLSVIFKSLKINDPKLIQFKRTFNEDDAMSVMMKLQSPPKMIEYKDGVWSSTLSNLEIFDIHYIEDYLFLGSFLKKKTKENLFTLVLGQKGLEHKNKCRPLIVKKDRIVKNLKEAHKNAIPNLNLQIQEIDKSLKPLLEQYYSYANNIFHIHAQAINRYLRTMAPYIKLKDFSYLKGASETEIFRIFLEFDVRGHVVQFLTPDLTRKLPNAKFALSEGDKSAIAVSFFLARLEIGQSEDKIVVFDDPLSSFDYGRKNTTINNLAQIALKCEQFFLLTHDLHFAKDFTDKVLSGNPINLKIEDDGISSHLIHHDIDSEAVSSLQRDIRQIKSYLAKGASSDSERREVVRCIRPILEGLIKTKYFEEIPKGYWLGDIIGIIRNSTDGSRLKRLQKILNELTELNDFSKQYHHANSSGFDDSVNPEELRTYSSLLLNVIDDI